MHIMVVRMATDPAREGEVRAHLEDNVKRRASRRDGYIGGRWMLAEDGRHAVGVVRFDSAANANAAAIAGPRRAMDDISDRGWNVIGVNIFEQVTTG